ncbi:heavy-metal-associated domain-containing protein [Fertoebacter nigrum]|uniref:Heavy-metal-associated domain-containing protein n=1 Tax=Fertoeibacter niger TaxID=2656921 RepID=A0A8X8H052_9RHOB|nr:heavy-metal-associated domain-containing protein [Fertoeibacter niger]NUB43028.1 heavy-metal-associated domain-containing protein [Fertoeibacter niger]
MTLLSVPDMTCGHCRASVESALAPLPGMAKVTVDLPARQVKAEGDAAPQAMLDALQTIGFHAAVIG